jgi:putative membrane protein
MLAAAHPLVHFNAALNSIAMLLLILALVFIRQGWEHAHKHAMRAALGVTATFLVCYLYYHFQIRLTVKFTHPGVVRYVYYAILGSHVLLAMTVPFLALKAAYLGTKALDPATAADPSFRQRHRSIVRWAYPIWLYVSVTGVVVYLMLYHLYPPADL